MAAARAVAAPIAVAAAHRARAVPGSHGVRRQPRTCAAAWRGEARAWASSSGGRSSSGARTTRGGSCSTCSPGGWSRRAPRRARLRPACCRLTRSGAGDGSSVCCCVEYETTSSGVCGFSSGVWSSSRHFYCSCMIVWCSPVFPTIVCLSRSARLPPNLLAFASPADRPLAESILPSCPAVGALPQGMSRRGGGRAYGLPSSSSPSPSVSPPSSANLGLRFSLYLFIVFSLSLSDDPFRTPLCGNLPKSGRRGDDGPIRRRRGRPRG